MLQPISISVPGISYQCIHTVHTYIHTYIYIYIPGVYVPVPGIYEPVEKEKIRGVIHSCSKKNETPVSRVFHVLSVCLCALSWGLGLSACPICLSVCTAGVVLSLACRFWCLVCLSCLSACPSVLGAVLCAVWRVVRQQLHLPSQGVVPFGAVVPNRIAPPCMRFFVCDKSPPHRTVGLSGGKKTSRTPHRTAPHHTVANGGMYRRFPCCGLT